MRVTQAAFAKRLGVAKSYVNTLKTAGRLVMTPDGMVDVEASQQRIAETADPSRDYVRARHAAARAQVTEQVDTKDTEKITSYQAARAFKERYAAMQAKLEYEKAIGKLIDRNAVELAIEDVMTIVRQNIDQQPHRLAPLLVGKDLNVLRTTLRQENNAMLAEMVREFSERLVKIKGD